MESWLAGALGMGMLLSGTRVCWALHDYCENLYWQLINCFLVGWWVWTKKVGCGDWHDSGFN